MPFVVALKCVNLGAENRSRGTSIVIDTPVVHTGTEVREQVANEAGQNVFKPKALVKEPKDAGLKKYSAEVEKFFDDLSKIEFPGSKPVHEAITNFGPSYVPGPISFVFEKVSMFIVVEEKKEEEAPVAAEAEKPAKETSGNKDKEIVVEEEKKEEEVVAMVEAAAEPSKAEEVASAEPSKP